MVRFLSYRKHPPAKSEPSPQALVLAHRERLLLSALQLLQDPQAALEVVLVTLRRALQSPLLVQLSEGALARWLDQLVVGLVINHLRGVAPRTPERRSVLLEILAAGVKDAPPPPPPPGSLRLPARFAQRPQGHAPGQGHPQGGTGKKPEGGTLVQIARTEELLCQLGPEAQVTLILVLMQGRSLADAAELLGVNEESTRFFLNHGRKWLRRALQRDLAQAAIPDDPKPPLTLGAAHELRRGKKTAARA